MPLLDPWSLAISPSDLLFTGEHTTSLAFQGGLRAYPLILQSCLGERDIQLLNMSLDEQGSIAGLDRTRGRTEAQQPQVPHLSSLKIFWCTM